MSWLFSRTLQHLPEATGEFVPGCMDVMLDYSKDGIFMRFYYPTNETKNNPGNSNRWCPWFPNDSYIVGIGKVLMNFTFLIRLVYWWSVKTVPVIYGSRPKLDQKLKCIIVSHGLGAFRSLYSNLCCELASRGYLVIVMEHRDRSACHTFYYQSIDDAKNKIRTPVDYQPIEFGKKHYQHRKEQVDYRAAECSKAVDFLINLNKGLVPHNTISDVPTHRQIDFNLSDFVGKLDLDTLTIAGHSFGGATALLTLSQRPELKQGILLDPWMYPIKNDNLHEKVTQPLLFINTQTFHITTNVDAMSKFLNGEHRIMYTILHTTHEHQTDTVLLFGSWLNWFMKKLEPLVALKINNSIILDFLDKYVGSPSDIEDYRRYFEEQKSNVEVGLTKPWV